EAVANLCRQAQARSRRLLDPERKRIGQGVKWQEISSAGLGVRRLRESDFAPKLRRGQEVAASAGAEYQRLAFEDFVGHPCSRLPVVPIAHIRAARLPAHAGEQQASTQVEPRNLVWVLGGEVESAILAVVPLDRRRFQIPADAQVESQSAADL